LSGGNSKGAAHAVEMHSTNSSDDKAAGKT
jgi:hypothetical protein